MKTLLALLAILGLALIGSWLARSRAQAHPGTRLFLASGAGYLLLGLALGPSGAGLLSIEILRNLLPLIGFSLGWVGVLLGAQYRLSVLRRVPGRVFLAAALLALPPVACVAAGLASVAHRWPDGGVTPYGVAFLAIGASTLSLPVFGFALRRGAPQPTVSLLFAIAGLIDLLPVALALVLSIGWLVAAGVAAWLAVAIATALSVTGGLAFSSLVARRSPRRDQLLLLLGLVTLIAGLASFFHLSPMAIGFVSGLTFVNSGRRSRSWAIEHLGRFERPIYMGLLVIAGARVVPQSALVVVVALGVLVVAKVAGSAMSTALLRAAFRSRVGDSQRFLWVLVPQGAVGLAVVLEARLLYPSWVPDPVLTVAVLGFLALELFVPLALRAGRHHPALEGAA